MTVIFKWNESEMQAALESCTRDEAAPILERHFPAGTRLLEAGCGAGRWVRFLQDRGRAMVGLEYSRETVSMVKRYWPDLEIVQGDCERSPFPDSSFDGVLSFGVVEHWMEGPQGPLRDLLRVVKPGGKAYIQVPLFNSIRRMKRAVWWDEITQAPRALAKRILRKTPKPLSRIDPRYRFHVYPAWGEFFEYRMSPGEFQAEVEKAGFEILEHLPVGAMDGVYHELNPLGLLVGWKDLEFRPRGPASAINRWLSRRPFAHPHMQAIVARKPMQAS
ncbi:MAG TPA: class I SAM-dependent methyltransferase [Candidatus Polarisedimenticolia bacterium]|nr:class I SAM-dependent methyltransferase [Candidatus Polarisedimenticolia bacterium]